VRLKLLLDLICRWIILPESYRKQLFAAAIAMRPHRTWSFIQATPLIIGECREAFVTNACS
jgi:hypothetical protein